MLGKSIELDCLALTIKTTQDVIGRVDQRDVDVSTSRIRDISIARLRSFVNSTIIGYLTLV